MGYSKCPIVPHSLQWRVGRGWEPVHLGMESAAFRRLKVRAVERSAQSEHAGIVLWQLFQPLFVLVRLIACNHKGMRVAHCHLGHKHNAR